MTALRPRGRGCTLRERTDCCRRLRRPGRSTWVQSWGDGCTIGLREKCCCICSTSGGMSRDSHRKCGRHLGNCFYQNGPGLCTPRPVAQIAAGNAHGKAGGQAVPAGWEGGRPRTRFSPLYVRRLYAEHSAQGSWAGGIRRGVGGAQSIAEGFPTAIFNLHPGFIAVGGIKGSMEPSVQGEILAPASDAGRVYCRVGRGSAALARRTDVLPKTYVLFHSAYLFSWPPRVRFHWENT